MTKRNGKITPEKRREIIRLAARGGTYREIADTVELSTGAIGIVVKPLGGVTRPEMWDLGTRRLSLEDRIEIRVGLERKLSLRAIARGICRDPATVCREVKANGERRTPPLRPAQGPPRCRREDTAAEAHQAGVQSGAVRQGRSRSETSVVTRADSVSSA